MPKIADFGVSRENFATETMTRIGTVRNYILQNKKQYLIELLNLDSRLIAHLRY